MHTARFVAFAALVSTFALLLAGCAGARVDPAPLAEEVARLREEARAMAPDSVSLGYLTVADTLSRGADTSMKEAPTEALSRLQEARGAAATAIAASVAYRRAAEAQSCAKASADARRDWQDALRMLDQTEKVAERSAKGVTRADAFTESGVPLPDPPESPAAVQPTADALRRDGAAWKNAAAELGVPSADLESAWTRALGASTGREVDPSAADHHLRVAGWAVTTLAWRVRAESERARCREALDRVQAYARYRDEALWAMVDLERSMKDSARRQLEEERARMEDRQEQLYNSLKQFEGKFASIRRDARGTIMSLADILFDFDKAVLRREAELNLAKVAVILDQFPEMHIFVEGHTDNVGKEEYNQKLSERRAVAVRDFLESQGVDAARMETQGFGMSQPVAPNDTEEGRQENRRVDLVIREE
jgi:outer membrane protein OmpA-like peptidoglycan-associated protein